MELDSSGNTDSRKMKRYSNSQTYRKEELTVTENINPNIDEDGTGPRFSSTIGIILSCMGCVVGTGNIWRFPRIVAINSKEEGGLVFLLVWIFFLLLWSSPLLLIEYGTGRFTGKAVVGSFRKFIGDNHIWCGLWVSLVTFFISCYYAVVLGWCFYYTVYYIGHSLPDNENIARDTFKDFTENSSWPVLTHFIAVVLAGLCVSKGVKTIEKVSMVLVPLLLALVLFTFVWSLTREHAGTGIKFMFTPKWETLKEPRLWVDAVSQNAFDTGAGLGIFIPYASYMSRHNGVVKYGHLVPAANNLVSLICGITVFGTVFSTLITSRGYYNKEEFIDILQESGPASTGLTFIWIPVLFETVVGFGRVLCIIFFISLSFAGVTSLMSNFELMTHTLVDFGLDRKFGMPLTILLTFSVGLPSALNINVLTNQDFVWGFALVINGMMLMYMVLKFGIKRFRTHVVNGYGYGDWQLTVAWELIIRVVAPLEAVAILIWWAVDLIRAENEEGKDKWYEFGRETFMVTVTQWLGLMLVVILANVVYVKVTRYLRNNTMFLGNDRETEPLLQSDDAYSAELTGSQRTLSMSVADVKL